MLYERWRQVAHEYHQELALRDLSSNRRWTFGQLAAASEDDEPSVGGMIYPQGIIPEFVIAVLRGWRSGNVILPLEAGQKPVAVTALPPEIVHLKTTSATTGLHRVVAFTAGQIMADAENIVQTMGLRPDWPNLGVISLSHSYGFSNLVLPLLLHGIPLLLLDSPLPELIRRTANVSPCLTLAAVPALWRTWHEAGAIPKNVRLAISAGAPLLLSLEESVFEKIGLKLHNFYGATECGGIAYDATDIPRSDAAGVGTPMRNTTLSIASDGCLEVRSAAVAEGYWPDKDPTLHGGCYHTSDLAEVRDGQIVLCGRVSDQINVAGRKVSPEMIESALRAHPLVRDCLVFGAPSPDQGRSEMIVAGVAAQGLVSAETLKQFLLARLPAWQVPREWWFVDVLAANARGKFSRAEWRKKFVEDRPRANVNRGIRVPGPNDF